MSETATATTTTTKMSDLEAKRQAVLASMKRRTASRSASATASPVMSQAALNTVNESVIQGTDMLASLEDAILDLRSLGYSFDTIVRASGVSRDFLEKCYIRWNFPVPTAPADPIVPERSYSVPLVNNTYVKSRQYNSNKFYRSTDDKPEWCNQLVISLESSDEESSDESEDESENQEDIENVKGVEAEQEENQQPGGAKKTSSGDRVSDIEFEDDPYVPELVEISHKRSRTSSETPSLSETNVPLGEVDVTNDDYDPEMNLKVKKRRLSYEIRHRLLTLDDIKVQTELLKSKIESLGPTQSSRAQRRSEIKLSLELTGKQIKENEAKMENLYSMIHTLESFVEELQENVETLTQEDEAIEALESEYQNYVKQLALLEAEEARLLASEHKRVELRNKLIRQMKEKKLKKQSTENLQTVIRSEQESDQQPTDQKELGSTVEQAIEIEDDTSSQEVGASTSTTTKEQESSMTTPNTAESAVYGDTIHKIPKVIIPPQE